ncbi:hypothetical protein [Pseudomonas sp. 24 E 13]|nr:hypothetical protein [Pseudomonas sp. 24 E 13]CRN00615.1 hypothetical protein [Pseudomonas sp. 34 E 7]
MLRVFCMCIFKLKTLCLENIFLIVMFTYAD